MSTYVKVDTPGGKIWMEVDEQAKFLDDTGGDDTSGYELTSGVGDKIEESFEKVIKKLKKNANYIYEQATKDSKPDEIEVSFSLKVAAEGGNTIFSLAKGSVEGGYTVTLKWTPEEDV